MTRNDLSLILSLNIFGLALFVTWYFPANHGFWGPIDSDVFYFFNNLLPQSDLFAKFVAITNNRAFDLIALLAMGALFLTHFIKQDTETRRRLFCMGLVMLITAVLVNQLGRVLPVSRPSPTLTFEGINRVSELTGIPTKDGSSDSFPGDHGLMLFIFAAFMLRYVSNKAFSIAVVIAIIFSLPRIMSGSHWFTDIYVGALSLACVTLSWILITPISDVVIDKVYRLTFRKNVK